MKKHLWAPILAALLLAAELVTVPVLQFPPVPGGMGLAQGYAAFVELAVIDAAAEKYAVIFRVPKEGAIRQVGFLTGTVAVNADSVIRCSLQDVSISTGDPDGTQDQTVDIAGKAITSNAFIVSGNLSADRKVLQGDLLAVVIEYQTFTASDSIYLKELNTPGGSYRLGLVGQTYGDLYTTSWVKRNVTWPTVGIIYSDGSYAALQGVYPISDAANTAAFNVNSATFDEVGLRISFPAAVRVVGGWFSADIDGDTEFNLYGSATRTVTIDKDQRAGTAGVVFAVYFAESLVVPANTVVHIGLRPTTTTGITVAYLDAPSAAAMGGLDGGAELYYAQRVDQGAWSYTTTRKPLMGLLIDQLDNGAGGAGAAMPTVMFY